MRHPAEIGGPDGGIGADLCRRSPGDDAADIGWFTLTEMVALPMMADTRQVIAQGIAVVGAS